MDTFFPESLFHKNIVPQSWPFSDLGPQSVRMNSSTIFYDSFCGTKPPINGPYIVCQCCLKLPLKGPYSVPVLLQAAYRWTLHSVPVLPQKGPYIVSQCCLKLPINQRWQQVIFCKSKSSHKSFPCKSKSSHKSFPCKSKSSHKSFGQTSSQVTSHLVRRQVKSQVIWSKHKSSHKSLCPSTSQVAHYFVQL